MMLRTLRLLRVVQWSMLASIVLYVAVGELVRPPLRLVNPSLSYMFTTLAVALVGVTSWFGALWLRVRG